MVVKIVFRFGSFWICIGLTLIPKDGTSIDLRGPRTWWWRRRRWGRRWWLVHYYGWWRDYRRAGAKRSSAVIVIVNGWINDANLVNIAISARRRPRAIAHHGRILDIMIRWNAGLNQPALVQLCDLRLDGGVNQWERRQGMGEAIHQCRTVHELGEIDGEQRPKA